MFCSTVCVKKKKHSFPSKLWCSDVILLTLTIIHELNFLILLNGIVNNMYCTQQRFNMHAIL